MPVSNINVFQKNILTLSCITQGKTRGFLRVSKWNIGLKWVYHCFHYTFNDIYQVCTPYGSFNSKLLTLTYTQC